MPKISRVEVLSPAAAVWMCPECGHGSPDIRDERAHLDAHRQLQAFFQEWEAGTESGQAKGRRSRRRLACLYAAVALVVVLLSVALFSRINGDTGEQRVGVPTIVIPDETMIPPAPLRMPVAPVVTLTEPPAERPSQAGRQAPTNTVRSATVVAPPAPAVGAQPAPTPAVAPPHAVVPAPAHLVHLCVLGICITVP